MSAGIDAEVQQPPLDLLEHEAFPPRGDESWYERLLSAGTFRTDLGVAVVGNCLDTLRSIPNDTLDLVVTSPPYDGQPKYGNGERYEREWYSQFFVQVTSEILRTLKPNGSFILNYRSKRTGSQRGTLQYELVFWLQKQGFRFAEDFVWANLLHHRDDSIDS